VIRHVGKLELEGPVFCNANAVDLSRGFRRHLVKNDHTTPHRLFAHTHFSGENRDDYLLGPRDGGESCP
jgi:hypothetical protein